MRHIYLFILYLLVLTSCGTVRTIPSMQKDTVYVSQTDTQYLRDSIYVYRYRDVQTINDTVYIDNTTYRYIDRWKTREVHDTSYIDRVDVQTVTKEVEKPLSSIQRLLIIFGKIFIVAASTVILLLLYRFLKR